MIECLNCAQWPTHAHTPVRLASQASRSEPLIRVDEFVRILAFVRSRAEAIQSSVTFQGFLGTDGDRRPARV